MFNIRLCLLLLLLHLLTAFALHSHLLKSNRFLRFTNSCLQASSDIIDEAEPTQPLLYAGCAFWEVYVDEFGVSHQRRRTVEGTVDILGDTLQLWRSPVINIGNSDTVFITLAPGIIYDWHENPRPQWIVPLHGRWFVETMDGERVEMGPGELSFGGDQNCIAAEDDGRIGHLSGAIDDIPCTLMLIQMAEPPL